MSTPHDLAKVPCKLYIDDDIPYVDRYGTKDDTSGLTFLGSYVDGSGVTKLLIHYQTDMSDVDSKTYHVGIPSKPDTKSPVVIRIIGSLILTVLRVLDHGNTIVVFPLSDLSDRPT